MPLFPRPRKAFAASLAQEVLDAIAQDGKKLSLLAKALGCQEHEVRGHPRLIEIMGKIEAIFSSWLDLKTPMAEVEAVAQELGGLHDRAQVPPSWVYAVMARVQEKARELMVPKCFFACGDRFMQTLIEFKEKQQDRLIEGKDMLAGILMEYSGIGFMLCDARHGETIVQVNQTFADMLGMGKEEIIGCTWQELTPPDVLQEELSRLAQFRQNEFAHYEKSFLRKDGSRVPVVIHYCSKPVPYGDKEVLVVGVVDISALKEKERAIEETGTYWREIFEAQAEGICIFSLDGTLHDFNGAYARLVGYGREELLKKGWKHLTPASYLPADQKNITLALEGETVRYEKAYIHKDGHEVPILISYRMLEKRPGWDKDRIVATCADLTALKQKEKELLLIAAYSRSCLERLASAEIIHDKDAREGVAQELQETYNRSVDSLKNLIHDVASAAEVISASGRELSQSQQSLSERASQEAANIEEISASIEEISATVSESAKSAEHARDLALDVRERLFADRRSLDEATTVILNAARSAQETTRIAQAIRKIASKTNILSLNASVEAAKAGMHGKGFGVIAEEVQKLSLQVGEESRRAEDIISALIQEVSQGETRMRQVADEIGALENQATDVAEQVQGIAEASLELDESLQEIARGVRGLEEGMSQNAAMAEELSATGAGMKVQTEALMDAVGKFHMEETGHARHGREFAAAVRKAISSHHLWRRRLLETIHGKKDMDPDEAGDFRRCDFGRFLEENQEIRALPQYDDICRLHRVFHQEARRIARLVLEGRKREAQGEITGASAYNRASGELMRVLEGVLGEAGGGKLAANGRVEIWA